jgi:hypothetical protein
MLRQHTDNLKRTKIEAFRVRHEKWREVSPRDYTDETTCIGGGSSHGEMISSMAAGN